MNLDPRLARPKTCAVPALLLLLTLLVGCAAPEVEATATPTKTPIGGDTVAVVTTPAAPEEVVATPTATVVETPTAETVAATSAPQPTDTATAVAPTATNTPIPPAVQPANAAPFTGIAVSDPAVLTRQPITVCINNDIRGRAQHHGLSQADVVYEFLMDGYVTTRLAALYHSRDVDHIGPVRSARFPNVWMGEQYSGLLACSGGSDAIRYLLKNEVTFDYLDGDIDDPNSNVYFFNVVDPTTGRLNYRTRLRTSTAGVRQWASRKGLLQTWNRSGFTYSQALPSRESVPSQEISISYPGGNSVRWVYDASRGGYLRFQGGEQQFDLGNGQPVVAQNVIVITTLHELTDVIEDANGTKGVDVKLYGQNDMLIFRDGKAYGGFWQGDESGPPRWNGFDGSPIPLKPGQSWVQAIRTVCQSQGSGQFKCDG